MVRVLLVVSAFWGGAISLSGCGDETRDVENYGSGNAITVLRSSAQHSGGYGRSECLVCHNTALNVHREKGSLIDADQLNEAARNNNEAEYCIRCHGLNGT